ncbi:MAG: sialate O-acetylesterase [Rikenellaceae bacterium]
MKKIILLAILVAATSLAEAKVTLPSLISDNAVLQQQSKVLLWGKATGKKVIISPSWTKENYTTKVASDGSWLCHIDTPVATEGASIKFSDGEGEDVVSGNILIGEVWFCSGQSNMKVPMKGNPSQPIEGSADVILSAKASIPIRLFTVREQHSNTPAEECEGEWREYTPENVASFGATPLFFARYLQDKLDVPVGVVNCSWGGSKIESWMSREVLEDYKEYDFDAIYSGELKTLAQTQPTLAYNGMLHAMKNLKFKGMLWYQGEANRSTCEEYPALFTRFAKMVRSHFDCGQFPIYYAQIAPYAFGPEGKGAEMRATQTKLMSLVERTGMVVLSDVGEHDCIHPRYKEQAGVRFAYWALCDTYGYKGIEYRAPEFVEMKEMAASGKLPKRVALKFNYASMGLSLSKQSSENFEVAGEDGIFYPAQMKLVSKDEYPIHLWCQDVEQIVSVRYGYKDYFKGDVFNNFGIPLPTFSTQLNN